ncbi:MAG: hypothetical protein ACXACY_13375 [Candidatus Hodarchaeales archaeon]|jgi:hypothetical protein
MDNQVAEKRIDNRKNELEQRLHNKLIRVLCKAGLSWSQWIHLIEIADYINGVPITTACWCYNEITKKERIIFSRRLLKQLPVQLLIIVLRHEMLHKALYRGTKNVANHELLNYCLDAIINKTLWMSTPKEAVKLGNILFPKQGSKPGIGRYGVMSIMNPGLETSEVGNLPKNIRKIWEELWWVGEIEKKKIKKFPVNMTCHDWWKKSNGEIGNPDLPDPMDLYYRVSSLLSTEQKEEIKQEYAYIKATQPIPKDQQEDGQGQNGDQDGDQDGTESDKDKEGGKSKKGGKGKKNKKGKSKDHLRGGKDKKRAVDKITLTHEKESADVVLGKIRTRGGGFSNYSAAEAIFAKYIYEQQATAMNDINAFIARWETMHQVEAAVNDIYGTFRSQSTIQPFPMDLTRLGMELVALGVSGPELPFYFNNQEQGEGGKKKICCYFDTSPSMDSFIPYMVWVAEWFDSLEECHLSGGKYDGKYAFSEKVKGIPAEKWEEFKRGEIRGGCGTSFDMVVRHAIERISKDKVDIIVVFTDGYSSVSQKLVEEFNNCGKKCYTIYFAHGGYSSWGGRADGEMTSDLDNLNGGSYTISCEGDNK